MNISLTCEKCNQEYVLRTVTPVAVPLRRDFRDDYEDWLKTALELKKGHICPDCELEEIYHAKEA